MSTTLAALAAAIQSIEQHARPSRDMVPITVRTGWLDVDHALGGGLRCGVLHEWFGDDDRLAPRPPHSLLIHLAMQATCNVGKRVLWIGERCWPYPRALVSGVNRTLLDHSIFVESPDLASRVWAIDHALRSPAVAAVVADGYGIDMAQSRRLQLAAEAGGTLALIARPSGDAAELSVAFTRWRVCACLSDAKSNETGTFNPRWIVELLRCKGMRPSVAQPRWVLEWNRAKGLVSVPADLGNRSGETSPAEKSIRRSA